MLAKQKIQQKDWQKAEQTSQKVKGGELRDKEMNNSGEKIRNQMINPTSE